MKLNSLKGRHTLSFAPFPNSCHSEQAQATLGVSARRRTPRMFAQTMLHQGILTRTSFLNFRSVLQLILIIPFLTSFCFSATPKTKPRAPEPFVSHFLQLDLDNAKKQAEQVLARSPHNVTALFVRMELAELQAQTPIMLDSALRLCRGHAPASVQEIASSRILHNAANSKAFNNVLPRVTVAAQQENGCSLNLKLALVAAAADGATGINLDQAAASAGLLTRWRISGPFGRYSNAEFEQRWGPELNRSEERRVGKECRSRWSPYH